MLLLIITSILVILSILSEDIGLRASLLIFALLSLTMWVTYL